MAVRRAKATGRAIWTRVIQPDETDMSPGVARYFLKMDFRKRDRDRMHELAVKNQQGKLKADEVIELQYYRDAALQLDLIRAKARHSLMRRNGKGK